MQGMVYITASERDKIAVWKAAGVGVREMARRLGRNHSVVSRELKRNKTNGYYVAIAAQAKAKKRKHWAGLRPPLKDDQLYAQIMRQLRQGWSPEIIAGRLKRKNGGKPVICHETIYRFIYEKANKSLKLWQYLARGRAKRRQWYGRKTRQEKIPNRVSIHDRPKEIETRKVFGHWEGDSVIGRGHKQAIHTEVERLSRYFQAKLLKSFDSEATVEAQRTIFAQLPPSARKSATLDNGLEFVKHEQLTQTLGMRVFFADPYCSCQRGTNENINGLLRRYLPKGTSFKQLTQEELDDIVWEINHRPKKCLNWATPQEVFTNYVTVEKGAKWCNSS